MTSNRSRHALFKECCHTLILNNQRDQPRCAVTAATVASTPPQQQLSLHLASTGLPQLEHRAMADLRVREECAQEHGEVAEGSQFQPMLDACAGAL